MRSPSRALAGFLGVSTGDRVKVLDIAAGHGLYGIALLREGSGRASGAPRDGLREPCGRREQAWLGRLSWVTHRREERVASTAPLATRP